MGDDCHVDGGGIYFISSAWQTASSRMGEASSSEEPGGGNCGGGTSIRCDEFRTSNTSLTSDSVVFVGDDSRLELFPVDEQGRAIPMRISRRPAVWKKISRFCNTNVIFVSILALLGFLIITILIIDG